jgi:hypothetical protein
MVEDVRCRALLDHAPRAHHDDLVGQRPDDPQIVADEQIRQGVARLELAEQVDDLRLHRHVERGRRLVEHYEPRPEDHGAGDRDALALAAGELVGVAIAARGIEADLDQRLVDEPATLIPGPAELVHRQSLLEDLRDRQARRQRAERVLKHDLHLPPKRTKILRRDALDLSTDELNRSLAPLQPEQREPQRGLARAAFPDHADGVAFAHRDADAVHRLDVIDRALHHAGAKATVNGPPAAVGPPLVPVTAT